MKQLLTAGFLVLMLATTSCKDKAKEGNTDSNNTTTVDNNSANKPVEVSTDDKLREGVNDVIKDFEGVKADVKDGIITLTGEIEKDRYITLKQALDNLRPKQVINNIKYK